MIEAMGLEGTKKVTTPAAEESHKRTEEEEEEGRQLLDAESTTAFRALVAPNLIKFKIKKIMIYIFF